MLKKLSTGLSEVRESFSGLSDLPGVKPFALTLAVLVIGTTVIELMEKEEPTVFEVQDVPEGIDTSGQWGTKYDFESETDFRRFGQVKLKVARVGGTLISDTDLITLVQENAGLWNLALAEVSSSVRFVVDSHSFSNVLCDDRIGMTIPSDEVRVCLYSDRVWGDRGFTRNDNQHQLFGRVVGQRFYLMKDELGSLVGFIGGGQVAVKETPILKNVVLHELGHVLGLADLFPEDNVSGNNLMGTHKAEPPLLIDEGTHAGIEYLYGEN